VKQLMQATRTVPCASTGLSISSTYDFTQDESNLTINVPVPAQASAKDVTITVGAERLAVSVRGHVRQPNVLEGVLYYDVTPESLAWELTGAGDARMLVVTLEKAEPVSWDEGLLRVQSACEAPPPVITRSSWSPLNAVASAATSAAARTPSPAAAAAAAAPTRSKASPPASACSRVTDYTRFDRLELSDEEDDSGRDAAAPLALTSGSWQT
jgi:hypothetical protein